MPIFSSDLKGTYLSHLSSINVTTKRGLRTCPVGYDRTLRSHGKGMTTSVGLKHVFYLLLGLGA